MLMAQLNYQPRAQLFTRRCWTWIAWHGMAGEVLNIQNLQARVTKKEPLTVFNYAELNENEVFFTTAGGSFLLPFSPALPYPNLLYHKMDHSMDPYSKQMEVTSRIMLSSIFIHSNIDFSLSIIIKIKSLLLSKIGHLHDPSSGQKLGPALYKKKRLKLFFTY